MSENKPQLLPESYTYSNSKQTIKTNRTSRVGRRLGPSLRLGVFGGPWRMRRTITFQECLVLLGGESVASSGL